MLGGNDQLAQCRESVGQQRHAGCVLVGGQVERDGKGGGDFVHVVISPIGCPVLLCTDEQTRNDKTRLDKDIS
jgi:hypothetical protein